MNNFIDDDDIDNITRKMSKLNINDNNIEESQDKKQNTQETSYDELIAKAMGKNKIRAENLPKFVNFLKQLFNNKEVLKSIEKYDTDYFYNYCASSGYGFLGNKEFFELIYNIAIKKLGIL